MVATPLSVMMFIMILVAFVDSDAPTSAPAAAVHCVMNPLSPLTLQNTSLGYQAKKNLFYANSVITEAWQLEVTLLTVGNTTFVPLPPFPTLCPQIITPIFTPNTTYLFRFLNSGVRNIVNATSAGVRCGLDCSSSSSMGSLFIGTPIPYRDLLGTQLVNQTTRYKNGTNITTTYLDGIYSNTSADISCMVDMINVSSVPPPPPSYDAVCTAYIQYNSSYWENSSTYAIPSQEEPVILDPTTTTLSIGVNSPIVIWLSTKLTSCPWYYNVSSLSDATVMPQPKEGTMSHTLLLLSLSYIASHNASARRSVSSQLPLVNAQCEVAASSHPVHGGPGVRIKGYLSTSQLQPFGSVFSSSRTNDFVLSYNLTIVNVILEYFLPMLSVTDVRGYAAVAEATELHGEPWYAGIYPPANLSLRGTMVPSRSLWWPMENYSLPNLSNVPRRCYASSPKALDNASTVVYLPTLVCTSGGLSVLAIDVINDTAFCCFVTAPSSPFLWPGFIEVFTTGTFWFSDTAGIIATPSPALPTLSPPSPGGGGGGGDNNSGHGTDSSSSSNSADKSNEISRHDAGDLSSSSNTAVILGVSLIVIGAVMALMAVVYFKWWKPRHGGGGGRLGISSHRQKMAALSSPHLILSDESDMPAEGVGGLPVQADGVTAAMFSPNSVDGARARKAVNQRNKNKRKDVTDDLFFDEVEPTKKDDDGEGDDDL
ncbi:membrane-associated protein, putative [Bodo saltans]|uniref:Membrane-associated protein, putative n=1 Tax=Bodo saltans TaxID=75058 RepID=A0A0S4JB40_BODSA|nr:membrane-associated protein, putative [Bodo saltans]|eukprot:CUG86372.1 membrane-associated protein, putative [Bodo saltans]